MRLVGLSPPHSDSDSSMDMLGSSSDAGELDLRSLGTGKRGQGQGRGRGRGSQTTARSRGDKVPEDIESQSSGEWGSTAANLPKKRTLSKLQSRLVSDKT